MLKKENLKKGKIIAGHWNELMKRMKELKQDIPLSDFLQQFFSDDKYENLRESVKHFAEGFDVADVSKVSTCSLI